MVEAAPDLFEGLSRPREALTSQQCAHETALSGMSRMQALILSAVMNAGPEAARVGTGNAERVTRLERIQSENLGRGAAAPKGPQVPVE